MDVFDFKNLDVARFSSMSLSELEYYRQEGNKLMAKMTTYDQKMWEVMMALQDAIEALRG